MDSDNSWTAARKSIYKKGSIEDHIHSNVIEWYQKELEYEKQLVQLKKLYTFVNSSSKKKDSQTEEVTLSLISSVKFMVSISFEIQELLEKVKSITYGDLLQWEPNEEFIEKVQDIESFVTIYELFCNNTRGYTNNYITFLFVEQPQIESLNITYSELIESVYFGIERYSLFIQSLVELEGLDTSSLLFDSCNKISRVNTLVQSNRGELHHLILRAEEIKQWSNIPIDLNIVKFNYPIKFNSSVNLSKNNINEGQCFLFLFKDILVICNNSKKYIGHIILSYSKWQTVGDNSFKIIEYSNKSKDNIDNNYNIDCGTNDILEGWINNYNNFEIISKEKDKLNSEDKISYKDSKGNWNYITIFNEMIQPEIGIIEEYSYRLTSYKNSFSSKVAFAWLTGCVTNSNELSIEIVEKWMEMGLIKLIGKNKKFQEKQKNYHFQLKFANCLNCKKYYFTKTARPAIEVSVDLLTQVVVLFQENRARVEKYKIEGMKLMAIHPSYDKFCDDTTELQCVDLNGLNEKELFIFFVNIYNTLALHSYIAQHNSIPTKGLNDLTCINFLSKNKYNIGGLSYSLYQIDHAVLRANSSFPEIILSSKIIPKFKITDERYKFALKHPNKLVNFVLSIGAVESPDVIILNSHNMEDHITEHIKLFCAEKVKIFIQGNKLKVVLPKIFHWFYKDFGNSYTDVVTFLLPYLRDRIKESLSFVKKATDNINIKFNNFNWDFHYSISPLEDIKTDQIPINRKFKINRCISDTHQYTWNIVDKQVIIEDILTESQFAFQIPFQYLEKLYEHRKKDLESFSNQHSKIEVWKNHLKLIEDAKIIYERQLLKSTRYKGLSFRPSTVKEDKILQFVPLNLHHHVTTLYHSNGNQFENEDENENEYNYNFIHSTFGAACCHFLKFKKGGIRNLQEEKRVLNSAFKSSPHKILQIDSQIVQRLDMCISQIITTIIDAIDTLIQFHDNLSSLFEQFNYCGILIHFESLLSTIGPEAGMLADMEYTIRYVNDRINIKFILLSEEISLNPIIESIPNSIEVTSVKSISNLTKNDKFEFTFGLEKEKFKFLSEDLRSGKKVPVKCALTTQGINEQQSVAIYRNLTKLQEDINKEQILVIEKYFNDFCEYSNSGIKKEYDIKQLTLSLKNIKQIITNSIAEKNTKILPTVADFVRSINGLRCTSCKSAKDRTSMSISWEQGRWLQTIIPNMDEDDVMDIVFDIREKGVRKENAFKNIGKQSFAFNELQRVCLPGPYRASRKITNASVKS